MKYLCEGKMKEIKRIYLLKNSITSLINKYGLKKHKITEFYTTISPLRAVSYIKMNDSYFKIVTHGAEATEDGEELAVTKKKFKKRFKERINEAIYKERYLFNFEGREYVIDRFKKALKGLYLLEVKCPDIESFEAFELPEVLQTHMITDISFNDNFKSKSLVLNGSPDSVSRLESIFTELNTKSHDELDRYFIPDLLPIDALRIILYKFSLLVLYYKERILDHGEAEDLHQFRISIRKSRAFLKEFKFLFPDQEYTYFNDNLSFFASQTNHKRDLDVIKERLKEVDTDYNSIQANIALQQEKETQKIVAMLNSKRFEDFFFIYQNKLRNETLLTSYNTVGTIENRARNVIGDLHQNIIKKINALEKNFSEKKLHKIRISFKKLRYLLEEFQHIFGEEKIENMIENGKKLQTLLGNFNDSVNQSKLLHSYFKSQKKSISDPKGLERKLLEKTSKSQKKLLSQTKKKLHQFKDKILEI